MKGRWISVGAAIGFALALTMGFAFGAGRVAPSTGPAGRTQGASDWGAVMDAMHESPQMQALHAQMPADWQAQCDAMHDQMAEWMQGAGPDRMGPGHMGSTTGGGMMNGGSGGSGMMGSGGSGGSGMMGSGGSGGSGMMGW